MKQKRVTHTNYRSDTSRHVATDANTAGPAVSTTHNSQHS